MRDYKLYVKQDLSFEMADGSEDLSDYVGVVTSGWKKILTPSMRKYQRKGPGSMASTGKYALTYPDNSLLLIDNSSGDYIPPGYEYISRDIRLMEDSRSFIDRVLSKCVVRAIDGYLFNQGLVPQYLRCTLSGGVPNPKIIRGWMLYFTSDERRHVNISVMDEGLSSPQFPIVIYQEIPKDKVLGKTSLTIRADGAMRVMLDSEVLSQDSETGLWHWEGDVITESTKLSVLVGETPVRRVEVIDD